MAEKAFTGLTAAMKTGAYPTGVTIGYISGVDLTLETAIIEILSFGMQYKEKLPSVKNWSASFDGTCAFAVGGSQETIYNAFKNSTSLVFGIFLDDTTYFEGTAFIKDLKISAKPDDKISLSGSLEGSGAIILNIPGTAADLTFACVDHATAGATSIATVAPTLTGGNSYMYCINGGLPAVGTKLTGVAGWASYALLSPIPCVNGARVSLAEVSTGDVVVKRGQAIAVIT